MTRPRQILLGVLAAAVLTLGLGIAVLSSNWAARRTQQEIIRQLETGFDATANVEDVTITIFPRVSIAGRGLTFTREREEHRLPFVRIERFQASGSLLRLLRRTIDVVDIEGLQIDVARGSKPPGDGKPSDLRSSKLHIDEIRVNKGLLRILPDDPEKLPLHFQLEEVTFHGFSFEHAGQYTALLTNPKPEGIIRSSGSFGPWNTYAPRSTPLSGDYEFADARLNTIKGIGGTLNSTGSFAGVLEHINVTGTTTTPDFQLDLARQPMKLDTRFRAIVDGTNGDTYLEEVDAMLEQTHIVAKGSVTGTRGAKGRTITLDVTADGRFEDFLRLAVKAPKAPMRGGIALTTAMVLPPGEIDVPQRLQLKGTFKIRRGQFTSDTVQDKVDELSRRGRGEPGNERVNNVVADFGGSLPCKTAVWTCPVSSSQSKAPVWLSVGAMGSLLRGSTSRERCCSTHRCRRRRPGSSLCS